MTVNEFAQLLQNELILPRDPHLVARFIALLDEYFASAAPLEPTAQDGVNVDLVPNIVGPIPITDIPPSTYSAPAVVREPTPADGVNIVPQEPSVADLSTPPEPVTSFYAPAPSLAESLPLTGSASTIEVGEFNPQPTESEAI